MSNNPTKQDRSEAIKDIKSKIAIERNIIQGYQDVKRNSTNAEVVQKCKSKIVESQTLIDFYSDSLNKLMRQMRELDTKSSADDDRSSRSRMSVTKPTFSRFDLIKYECPSLGHKIQHMIQQLQFKLQVENQYREANMKISHLYLMDGDKSSSNAAEGGRAESDQKIQLLEKTLRKYQSFNINYDDFNKDYEIMDTPKHVRKPLSGKLTIGVTCVRDVDHMATAAFKKRETIVVVKIDDVEKARTRPSKNDNWSEEMIINVDKSHEIELTVMDKQAGNYVPIAINWLSLFDLAEEIRKKKVANDPGASGWLPASNLPQTSDYDQTPFQSSSNTSQGSSLTLPVQNDLAPSKSPIKGDRDVSERQKISVNTWISLEPCGQMLVNLNFEKSVSEGKQFAGPLGRHGAIRQKKEEIFEQQGHHFVQKQFYNIMCCALCGEFLRYTGFQCQDCKFLCHKKCYQKVVTKCISKPGSNDDAAQLKHRIPHRFEPITNHGTKWCCHCGYLLPWGKKNARKCSECGVMCHAHCTHLVPDLCGMSLQMANEILATIKSTKVSPKKDSPTREKFVPSGNEHQSPLSQQRQKPKALPPKPATSAMPSYNVVPTLNNQYQQHKSHREDDRNIEKPFESKLPTTYQNHQLQEPAAVNEYPRAGRRRPPTTETEEQAEQAEQEEDGKRGTEAVRQSRAFAAEKNQLQTPEKHRNQSIFGHEDDDNDDDDDDDDEYAQQHGGAHNKARSNVSEVQYDGKNIDLSQTDIKNIKDNDGKRDNIRNTFENFEYNNHSTQDQVVPMDVDTSNHVESPFADQHQQLQKEPSKAHSKSSKSKRRRRKVGLDDFQFLAVLGKGNFGKVMLAESRHTQKLCAIKVLKKDFIVENDEAESVKSEKRVFLTANKEMHPFLLNLHCCFQTENRIYFVMEYISGGDLMWHIQNNRFTARRAKYYACEVLLGLKYFHDSGIVYRDLKLDNILLTTKGHIKIADYGLCKENMWHGNTTSTFCGTPEFMAPEIVTGKKYDRSVDWWAFGVLLFQMLLCQSPFKGDDEDDIFNAIEHDEVKFPVSLSGPTVLVLQALLTKDPQQRLGSSERDAEEIMEHPYFQDVNFDDVLNCRVPPPFIPELKSEHDYSNFDKEFTSETPRLTPVETVLTSEMQEQFRGFSHISDHASI
ncbi:Serine/threonine kinase [Lodderomyces elongisporus]|uniref:Serine/threonine kinase n=1 Tax=Lodderomyces elongisporus TaxID=36914 RepID=UPI00291D3387|nr:Serine/threonine kinase [Lodderomyces elongisporus]WLF79743.1 Serine/threonine kinase [Lodderomyces elongisporus]